MNSKIKGTISKPTPILREPKSDIRNGCKTAPYETEFTFDTEDLDGDTSSYNYYIYYNSIKPRDPRLKKPTYNPYPDLDFIKDTSKFNPSESIFARDFGINDNKTLFEYPKNNINSNINSINNINNTNDINTMNCKINTTNIKCIHNPLSNNNITNNLNISNNNISNNSNNNISINPITNGNNNNIKNISNNSNNNILNSMNKTLNDDNISMSSNIFPSDKFFNISSSHNEDSFNVTNENENYPYSAKINNNNINQILKGPFCMGRIPIQSTIDKTLLSKSSQFGNFYPQFSYQPYYIRMIPSAFPANFNYEQIPFAFAEYPYLQPPQKIKKNNNKQKNIKKINNNNNNTNYNNNSNNNVPKNKNKSKKDKIGKNKYHKPFQKQFNQDTYPFDEVCNNIITLSKDHSGSRFIQRQLDEYTDEQKEKLISLMLKEFTTLSKDVFGNYVIQKLLICVNKEMKRKLIKKILYKKQKELTMHMYSCRVIQKALELADEEDIKNYIEGMSTDIRICVQDQYGNHVIQKVIEKLQKIEKIKEKEISNNNNNNDNINLENIFKYLKGDIYELSVHQFGCRVIQKLYECSNDKIKQKILDEIYDKFNHICIDQYGNYVLQSILENMKKKIDDKIVLAVKGKVYDYSVHKYASNVIEKILVDGTKVQINDVVEEIIIRDEEEPGTIENIVKDKFGNYVIQKMIENSDTLIKEKLIQKIIDSPVIRQKEGFCKHVMLLIEKLGYYNDKDKKNKSFENDDDEDENDFNNEEDNKDKNYKQNNYQYEEDNDLDENDDNDDVNVNVNNIEKKDENIE